MHQRSVIFPELCAHAALWLVEYINSSVRWKTRDAVEFSPLLCLFNLRLFLRHIMHKDGTGFVIYLKLYCLEVICLFLRFIIAQLETENIFLCSLEFAQPRVSCAAVATPLCCGMKATVQNNGWLCDAFSMWKRHIFKYTFLSPLLSRSSSRVGVHFPQIVIYSILFALVRVNRSGFYFISALKQPHGIAMCCVCRWVF